MLHVHTVADETEPSFVESSSLAAMSSVIQASELTKRYGKKQVVNNISFSIPRGSVFGLIGPNGAGKSTTLKMLMGLTKISGGKATVLDADVHRDFQTIKHRIGYVPETHHIYRWMKVKRVIRFAKSFYENWNDDFCSEMLEMLELEPNKRVKQLSKGMLAKLALLLAISHEPELLILDEPMSGLDPIVREEFIDGVMQAICNRDTTVILSSHTIGDVQRLADSVGVLYEGQLLVNRPVEDLLSKTKRIRIVLPDGVQLNWFPDSMINQNHDGRELTLTVDDFSPLIVDQLLTQNQIEHLEVEDINLEFLFKDYINGQKPKHKSSQAPNNRTSETRRTR